MPLVPDNSCISCIHGLTCSLEALQDIVVAEQQYPCDARAFIIVPRHLEDIHEIGIDRHFTGVRQADQAHIRFFLR